MLGREGEWTGTALWPHSVTPGSQQQLPRGGGHGQRAEGLRSPGALGTASSQNQAAWPVGSILPLLPGRPPAPPASLVQLHGLHPAPCCSCPAPPFHGSVLISEPGQNMPPCPPQQHALSLLASETNAVCVFSPTCPLHVCSHTAVTRVPLGVL